MKNTLSKSDVSHLAKLANLTLTDDELEHYTTQIDETIHSVENLHELNTDNIKGTNNLTNTENVFFNDGTQNQRALTQPQALQNAPNTSQGFFTVKKIMEND